MVLCEKMVWIALELPGYKLVWSTDGSVLPAVNWKWSCSSLNAYTIYMVVLSKIGNFRLNYSKGHKIAYSVQKFMSELELNGIEWCTEVSTQTHVLKTEVQANQLTQYHIPEYLNLKHCNENVISHKFQLNCNKLALYTEVLQEDWKT